MGKAAGVLIAAQINQLEIVQQPRLQLDQLNSAAQGFKDDQPFAQAVAMLARQTVQDRNEPAEQVDGGLLDRQFGAGGDGHGAWRR